MPLIRGRSGPVPACYFLPLQGRFLWYKYHRMCRLWRSKLSQASLLTPCFTGMPKRAPAAGLLPKY